MPRAKTTKKKPTKKRSLRELVRTTLPKEAQKFYDQIDADDPSLLATLVEATAAQMLAANDEYYKTDDPVYRAVAIKQVARLSEELRKLCYLRVQDKAESNDEIVEIRLLRE